MTNIVYIGTSLDGFIAAADGSVEWMNHVPIPEGEDLGFHEFMERIDAVVMGRSTFETLIGFDVGWHYPKPGIILSSTLRSVPDEFAEHVRIASGSPAEIVGFAEQQGYGNLYIDGGETIRRFLRDDLIDEIIITTIPILLGSGVPLFGDLETSLGFELVEAKILLNQLVRRHYRRKRE